MRTRQICSNSPVLSALQIATLAEADPELILYFGGQEFFEKKSLVSKLREAFPKSILFGCSAMGEINSRGVDENSVVITAIRFEVDVKLRFAISEMESAEASFAAGAKLGRALKAGDLQALFVLGPGTEINGSKLIAGLTSEVDSGTLITGGLAGDGANFQKTWTLLNEGCSQRAVVALGIYGKALKIGYGSAGGWLPFGPARRVTESSGNILKQLDGQPALTVYKKYLGDKADGLPNSGLLYPFAMLAEDKTANGLIRTILGINEEQESLILAGDIDEGGWLRLMHSNLENLVQGAGTAASEAMNSNALMSNGLAILVSCVGRKIVLGSDVENEIDAVREVFGANSVLTGFYSHGEICPFKGRTEPKLHNQTMTVTYFHE